MSIQGETIRVALAASLVVLSGCVAIGVESTVAADGTIEEYVVEIETPETVYSLLQSQADSDGYDSVEEMLLSGINESAAGEVRYNESRSGGNVTMTITMRDVRPSGLGNVSVTREDGRLVYEDETFYNESAASADTSGDGTSTTRGIAVDYVLTMPGEVVESNADEVDGNTAEWHATGQEAFTDTRIYAESEVSSSAFGPGFGAVAALVGLLAAVALLARRGS